MLSCGVPRDHVLGQASDYELFCALCEAMPNLVGHPLYDESHWELEYVFDCSLEINKDNCGRIWQMTAERLRADTLSPTTVLAKAGVRRMCTPYHPWDTLPERRQDDPVERLPIFCPDGGMELWQGTPDWMRQLSRASGVTCSDWESVCEAYRRVLDAFHVAGCRMALHTMSLDGFSVPNAYGANHAIQGFAAHGASDAEGERTFGMMLLRFLMTEYERRGWTMELRLRGGGAWEHLLRYAQKDRGWQWPRTVLSCTSFRHREQTNRIYAQLAAEQSVGLGGVVTSDHWEMDSVTEEIRAWAAYSPLGMYPGLRTHLGGVGCLWQHQRFRLSLCKLVAQWHRERELSWGENGSLELLERVCFSNAYRMTDPK